MLHIKCINCEVMCPEDNIVNKFDSSYCPSCALDRLYNEGWCLDRIRQAIELSESYGNGGITMENEQKKVGAIWNRISKAGDAYLFIDMDGKEFVAFTNKSKTEQKHPDLIMYESRPRETEPEPVADPKSWKETWGKLSPAERYRKLDKLME